MNRFIDLKTPFLLVFALASCSQLKPEEVKVPEYPDLKQLIRAQANLLAASQLEKTVTLDGQSETNAFKLDSADWAEELSFLKEINPNQPEYVGAFDRSEDEGSFLLKLKENNTGEVKSVRFTKTEDRYQRIEGVFHEDKDVYVHHREIQVEFSDGIIAGFKVEGYQKMILKDTVWFSIEGAVQN